MAGVNVPTIQNGATPATLSLSGGKRQFLVENTDALNAIDLAWNGSGGAWRLQPGQRIGLYVVGGVVEVTLTPAAGNPTYQALIYP